MKKLYLLLLVLATVFVACKKDRDVEFSTFTVEDEKIVASYTSMDLSCKVRCAATINEFYLQYDTVEDFSTYQEVALTENEKTEVYSVKIGDLLDNTTYYVRYVAVNSYSQVTSEEVSEFKTLQATTPTIEVREITDVLDTIATVGFVLKFNGGADVTKMGVCWSVDSVPTIEDKYVECSRDAINCVSDGDSLVLKISGLEANTIYYVRAYAENMKGVGYSESKAFVTLTLPEVETEDVTDIQLTSGWLNGLVLFNGNDTTTEYGFCWGEEADLTIEDSQNVKAEVAEDSTFTYRLSNLQDETKYYVRAYAKNKIGLVYGEVKEFTTQSTILAVVVTAEALDVTYTSAKVGGKVEADGGSDVTERGICYSTTKSPTIENKKVVLGTGLGSFTTELSDLQDGTKYYVRAYAKNKKGVSYGETVVFETKAYLLAEVVTSSATDVTYTSAKVGGTVVSDGGIEVVERGVCYSTTENPTIADSKVIVGKGLGSFATELSDLQDGTKYYVRAYAINKKGVSYGEMVEFETKVYLLAEVITSSPTDVTYTSAEVGGTVEADGGLDVTERGICYSTSENPTIENNKVVLGKGLGRFTTELSDLQDGTKYYVRAYAINKKGGSYGEIVEFETKAYSLSEVVTSSPTDVTYTSAKVGGTVVSDGGVEVVERGVCYSTTENPTIADSTIIVGKGLGSFTTALSDLQDGTKYYVRAYAINKKGVSYGDKVTFETLSRYVDLGLPSGLKWAICNVGATTPEEYGDYFAWGEVEPKTTYNWSTYKYCNGSSSTLTKYCNNSSYGNNGFTDNKTVLDPEDDAATANWGGAWRMPTYDEFSELKNNCTWTWTIQNGVNGYKVVGPNGNSIFLPAGGFGGAPYYAGSVGEYWSSSLVTYDPNFAYYVYFGSDFVSWSSGTEREVGQSVRPVYGELVQKPEIKQYTISVYSIEDSYGRVYGGGTYDEGAQVTITATPNSGYKFTEWNDGNTENPRKIVVTQNATYIAIFEKENFNAGHEYVDLGLPSGLKWATCNVGATTPEEYGDYFAWGEVEPKEYYYWSTYKYGTASDQLTKYCSDSSYGKDGFTDSKTVLDPEDDAATANWGGAWRMPTDDEMYELKTKCTWTWTTQNGVNGYKVTGPNGNSIFLPVAGCMDVDTFNGSYGYYWSSSLGPDLGPGSPKYACGVSFNSDYVYSVTPLRYSGQSVRPVCQ